MRYVKFYIFLLISGYLFTSANALAQLTVTPNQTAAVLAARLTGPGITISSPVLTCAGIGNGTFYAVSTPLAIDSGIILTSGQAVSAIGPESILASTNVGTAGDASLTALAAANTHDACVLEFDFVPKGDTVSFNYQFGSEEYNNSVCGQYNDAFAFFISGPGIAGTQNMALVPGTTIPVTVNSINNGVPGSPGAPAYCNIANCTGMGSGSPFTSYYYDNTGGTQLTYKGFAKKLVAAHDVIPCNTYHLKIAIADASNSLYDSGVFIESGSLKTNSFSFNHADSVGVTINGLPNTIVRGCAPASITVISNRATSTTQTVHFTFGGTAVQGVDYTAPDSTIIAAGADSTIISIAGLIAAPTGAKTLEIYLQSPFSCGIVDSISINIMDTPTAFILTPNTTICSGSSIQILATGSNGLAYNWSPAASLNSASVMEPTASPAVTTIYTMTATLPGTGCAAITKNVMISVTDIGVSILTPDTTICLGTSVGLLAGGDPGFTYSWSPIAGLNNPSITNPIATPSATTIYTLTATSPVGCQAIAEVTINVAPANAALLTMDTTICNGASVQIRVAGNPSLHYSWSPASSLDNANIMQPVATPSVTTTYQMLAVVPGSSCSAIGTITINIESITANAGPDLAICQKLSIPLDAGPNGDKYSYLWNGPNNYTSDQQNPVINNAQPEYQGVYTVTVTDHTTGCSAASYTTVSVIQGTPLTNITLPQTIPYGSSIQLNADNAVYYRWTPEDGSLNNPNINNPVATPSASTTYIVYGLDAHGCTDSAMVTVNVTYDSIFIPNAFTPNGDGLNDVFRVGNLGYYKLAEMSIFNRWGVMVYHVTDGRNNGWDGTYNGVSQELGVFNYIIVISEPNGTLKSFKGDVTLIR